MQHGVTIQHLRKRVQFTKRQHNLHQTTSLKSSPGAAPSSAPIQRLSAAVKEDMLNNSPVINEDDHMIKSSIAENQGEVSGLGLAGPESSL